MPRYKQEKRYQLGEWWVGKKSGSPAWHRCRYNPETEQTERRSLGETDYESACRKFDQWFIESNRPQAESPSSITLAEIIGRYWQEHAQHIASASTAKIHCGIWLDYWGDAVLSDITPSKQKVFHTKLREQGKSDSYIQRMTMTVQAAVNHAYKNGDISQPIYFVKLEKSSGKPHGRPMEIVELKALLDAASPQPHLQRYIKTLIATAARPGAVLSLHSQQIDRERGIITLNPPDRNQTKKYRPVIRLPESYALDIADITGNIISGNEGQYDSVKKAWRTARSRAGLDVDVNGYSIRHTIARHLRSQSVPPWEVAAQLGHKMPGMSTTEIYAPYDPSYLKNAVAAIDDFYKQCCL